MELGESAAKGAARDNLEEAQADVQVVTHPDIPLTGQRKRKEKTQEVGTGNGFDLQGEKKEKKRKPTASQTVEEVGSAGGFEVQVKKKKKEKKRGFFPSQTVEEVGTGGGFEAQGKRKEKKREFAPSQTVEEVGTDSGFEVQDKRKKEKKRKHTPSQTVEEVGTAGGFEVQGKRKKDKKREFSPPQTVEEVGTASCFEVQGKRKKDKKREFFPPQTIEEVGTANGFEVQGKRKKEKKRKSNPSQTVGEVGIGNGLELQGKKEKKQKEKKRREFTPPVTVEDVDEAGIGSGDESRRKRRKMDKSLTTSQPLEDCRPKTGTAKEIILTTQETQTGNGAESVRKKKKVTFELPNSTQDDSSEKELLGEVTETMHTSTNYWKADESRHDLDWGVYTPQEDGALKQAIFDYIQEQGWDREDGLKKVLNCGKNEARGCWKTIRKCLPRRTVKRLYTRAHRLFDPGNFLGKWTSEEIQSLIELHSVHGNKWKKISTVVGRDALNCKDKWRFLKHSDANGRKKGRWSEEELQKLCTLVFKCLHVRRQMAKKGQLRKHHKVVRDEINWEFIAEQIDGRNRLDCMGQWYNRMASPMVKAGDWSNGDDQHLLERLTEEFPLSEELVEWDSLLEHRSGEICKRRWEQMQRSLGQGPVLRHSHFLEKLAAVVRRFAPHLADAEYDPQFAVKLEQADANESEDNVDT